MDDWVFQNIKVIAFDADDTLWENEPYFQDAQREFGEIVRQWIHPDDVVTEHYKTEIRNIPIYGYGIKGFTLSLIETAMHLSDERITAKQIKSIIEIGKRMHNHPVNLIDEVEEVLQTLSNNFRLIVATKGDLLDQERKLQRSKLEKYFHHVEIMSDKTEAHYQSLLDHLDIPINEFLMIGNSLKSDIVPVLNLGGMAIHIPFHIDWVHENVDTFDPKNARFTKCSKLSDICKLLKNKT